MELRIRFLINLKYVLNSWIHKTEEGKRQLNNFKRIFAMSKSFTINLKTIFLMKWVYTLPTV